jgi:IPT/TIG domain
MVNSTELDGTYGAPDTGRTPIQISGRGFAGQLIAPIEFTDTKSPFSVGTQYTFTVNGNTSVSTQTVAQNPALVDVRLCTVTACSRNRPADLLYIYPPGNPRVTSVSPASGLAAAGTKVTIGGNDLGCPLAVFFGNVKAESFTPARHCSTAGQPPGCTPPHPPEGKAAKYP